MNKNKNKCELCTVKVSDMSGKQKTKNNKLVSSLPLCTLSVGRFVGLRKSCLQANAFWSIS